MYQQLAGGEWNQESKRNELARKEHDILWKGTKRWPTHATHVPLLEDSCWSRDWSPISQGCNQGTIKEPSQGTIKESLDHACDVSPCLATCQQLVALWSITRRLSWPRNTNKLEEAAARGGLHPALFMVAWPRDDRPQVVRIPTVPHVLD